MWWTWVSVASATWTVAAVDPDTGEVGAAGATCGPFVWMVAELAPGEGAAVAQYATSLSGKRAIAEGLAAGETPEEALARVVDLEVDPKLGLRQYGVVGLRGPAASFTGGAVESWAGWRGDDTVSVQGNTLRGPEVVEGAFDAFRASEGEPLAERLLLALEAGRDAGGDRRCPAEEPERSAFVAVADPDGTEDWTRASASFHDQDPIDRLRGERSGELGCALGGPGLGWLGAIVAAVGVRRRDARRIGRIPVRERPVATSERRGCSCPPRRSSPR